MYSLYQILSFALDILWFIVLANVIMSWLVNFQVLNIRQPLVAQIYAGLERIMAPIYGPIRRILPTAGGLDFTPLVVIFGIFALRVLLQNNVHLFL